MQAPTIGGVRLPRGNGQVVRLPRGASLTDFAEKIDASPADLVTVLFKLGEMVTRARAARLLTLDASEAYDRGERCDKEAGMAKYLASEYCKEVVEDSFRIHGGYGYSKEYEIERLYREAPMLMIGEGTADIQKMIIARRLLGKSSSELK